MLQRTFSSQFPCMKTVQSSTLRNKSVLFNCSVYRPFSGINHCVTQRTYGGSTFLRENKVIPLLQTHQIHYTIRSPSWFMYRQVGIRKNNLNLSRSFNTSHKSRNINTKTTEGPRQAAEANILQKIVFASIPVVIGYTIYKKASDMRKDYDTSMQDTTMTVPFDRIMLHMFQGTSSIVLNHPKITGRLGMCEVDINTVKFGINNEGSWVSYPIIGEYRRGQRQIGTVLLELLPKKTEEAKPHEWVLLHIEVDFHDGDKMHIPFNITYNIPELFEKIQKMEQEDMERERRKVFEERRKEYAAKKKEQ